MWFSKNQKDYVIMVTQLWQCTHRVHLQGKQSPWPLHSGSVWGRRCAHWLRPRAAAERCSSSPLETRHTRRQRYNTITQWRTAGVWLSASVDVAHLWSCASVRYTEVLQVWMRQRIHLCQCLMRQSPVHTHTQWSFSTLSLIIIKTFSGVFSPPPA